MVDFRFKTDPLRWRQTARLEYVHRHGNNVFTLDCLEISKEDSSDGFGADFSVEVDAQLFV
jgi:hypothetical protein